MSFHNNFSKLECKLLTQLSNISIASAILFTAISLGQSWIYFYQRLYLLVLDLTHCIKAILNHITEEQDHFNFLIW